MLTSKKPIHSLSELQSVLSYDPETGLFKWKKTVNRSALCGAIAGTIDFHGYRQIFYQRKMYKAHRLAFYFMTGSLPDSQVLVDHENRNKSDNRFDNLRLANTSNNQASGKLRKNNTSGFKGVSFSKTTGKWMSSIKHNYRLKNLGLFDSPEIAAIVYDITALELFGKFAKTNF